MLGVFVSYSAIGQAPAEGTSQVDIAMAGPEIDSPVAATTTVSPVVVEVPNLSAVEIAVESSETTEPVAVPEVAESVDGPAPTTSVVTEKVEVVVESVASVTEEDIIAALNGTYQFDEVSNAVLNLQEVLGGIATDSHYGSQTRNAHIEALEARGLDTAHVPAVATGSAIPSNPGCDVTGVAPKYVVGDSLSVGVEMTGFIEDASGACLNLVQYSAKSGRRTEEAVSIVNSWGTLGSDAVVLVALGTNDIWGSQESFVEAGREVMNAIGSNARVIWLDVSEDILNVNETRVNNGIAQLASEYSNIQIADWSAYEAAYNVRRAGDGIHYTLSEYKKRASSTTTFSQRLTVRDEFRTAKQDFLVAVHRYSARFSQLDSAQGVLSLHLATCKTSGKVWSLPTDLGG